MARNEVYPLGRQLAVAVTSPATPAAGDPVIVKNLAGVALEAKNATTGLTSVKFDGVFTLPVANATAVGDVIGGAAGSPVVLTGYATIAAAVAAAAIIFGHALAVQAGAGSIAVRLGR
jgi:predicted RecA/RadA family phage recombinase